MATYAWTGLGLADGTVLSNANINTAGNGDTVVYQALSGTATRVTRQESNGNGVEITDTSGGGLARIDTGAISGGAECMAYDFIFKAPASNPTLADHYFIVGRNANATPASTTHCTLNTSGAVVFKNAADVAVSGGTTPAVVAGHYYHVSGAVILNTTTTPTTSNGRIIGRVQSLTSPGTWNSGSEFQLDTGYTVNVTVDKTDRFRTGKATTTNAIPSLRFLNLKWRDLTTPNTGSGWSNASSNLVQATAPTVSTSGEGQFWLMYNVGTPAAGGALTYSYTQTGGTTTTPTMVGTNSGIYKVVQSTSGALTYDITVSESGGGSVTTTHTVPAATTLVSGQFRCRVQVGGVLV